MYVPCSYTRRDAHVIYWIMGAMTSDNSTIMECTTNAPVTNAPHEYQTLTTPTTNIHGDNHAVQHSTTGTDTTTHNEHETRNHIQPRTPGYPGVRARPDLVRRGTPAYEAGPDSYAGVPRRTRYDRPRTPGYPGVRGMTGFVRRGHTAGCHDA